MILFYAPGEGLGHLTRVRSVIHTLQLQGPVAVVTDAKQAGRILPDATILPPGENLQQVLERLRPDAVYVDAFPAGIEGELCGIRFEQPVFHCARILQWTAYSRMLSGKLPRFECTFVCEPISGDHYQALATCSEQIKPIRLIDPPVSQCETLFHNMERSPFWLIVHAGPVSECEQLVAYAWEAASLEGLHPRLVLIAPHSAGGLAAIDCYPADTLFPYASRIITACGFNTMRQTQRYSELHRYLPFPRRFDDQFLRAALRRSAGPRIGFTDPA